MRSTFSQYCLHHDRVEEFTQGTTKEQRKQIAVTTLDELKKMVDEGDLTAIDYINRSIAPRLSNIKRPHLTSLRLPPNDNYS